MDGRQDMNTDGRVMAWFFDEYSKYHGFAPGVVTGKVALAAAAALFASGSERILLALQASSKLLNGSGRVASVLPGEAGPD